MVAWYGVDEPIGMRRLFSSNDFFPLLAQDDSIAISSVVRKSVDPHDGHSHRPSDFDLAVRLFAVGLIEQGQHTVTAADVGSIDLERSHRIVYADFCAHGPA